MIPDSKRPTPARQRLGRIGWAILLVTNILLFLVPANYTPKAISLQTWLVIMIGFLLLTLSGFLIGLVLLFVRYLPFFKQGRATVVLFIALLLGMRIFVYLQNITKLAWPFSRIMLLLPVWLLVLLVALPIVLAIYLWHQDQSVRILGYTLLIIVWALVIYVNQVGPEALITNIIRGQALPELMGMFCFGESVIFLTLLFFAWHTLRLIYCEWKRADMQSITDRNFESPFE